MATFRDMIEVHREYKYPDSFQHRRTLYDTDGVIRVYCNGEYTDVIKDDSMIVWLPVDRPHIRAAFETSREIKRSVQCFRKRQSDGRVEDLGCWRVVKTDFNYAKLKPV